MSRGGRPKRAASFSDGNNVSLNEETDVVLRADQLKQFLSTMYEFSENCSRCVEAVECALEETKKKEAESVKNMKKLVNDVKKMKQEITDSIDRQQKEIAKVRLQFENFEERNLEFGKKCGELHRILELVEGKETFMCSLIEATKETERVMWALYKRSLFAGTTCREIATVFYELSGSCSTSVTNEISASE